MNLNIVSAILGKELAETLRDKRTLMAMIGVPLLLYPGIILILGQAAVVQRQKLEQAESRVVVEGEAAERVRGWLASAKRVKLIESQHPVDDLRDRWADAVVHAPAELNTISDNASAKLQIEYDSTEPKSRQALDRIQRALDDAAEAILAERLDRAGLERGFTRPLDIEEHNVAPPAKRAGFVLGSLLPLLMIVMIGVGAFYPAVDLTAGEKERGTFETLLSTPVSKTEIVCAKFLAVISLALLTGLLNLASMAATLGFQLAQAAQFQSGDGEGFSLSALHISPQSAAFMFAVLIPLTVFIGAAMMSIAIFARDFKEANNYVAPFFLFITIPGALAALPGVELTRATACIPITNVALLFRDLLTQKASVGLAFIVLVSTAVYAMLTLVVAVRLFQSEEVVLSQEKGIPLSIRRSQFTPRSSPTAGLSLTLFGLCLLLFFYVGSYVQGRDLMSGVVVSQWGLFFLPVVALLLYVKVDLKSALSLNRFPWASLPGMLLLWLGMLILVNQFAGWQNQFLPAPEGYEKLMGDLFRKDGTLWGSMVMVLAVGLSPAICEEVLFRGAILSGLRTVLSPGVAVLAVGLMFGVMHVSLGSILPTAMLGVAMGYLVVRTGSIYPAMLFHLLNNTVALVYNTKSLPDDFMERLNQMEPAAAGMIAGVSSLLGVAILESSHRFRRAGLGAANG